MLFGDFNGNTAFKAVGERFISCFDQKGLAKAAKSMLEKEEQYQTAGERLQALCIFIDCIEYGLYLYFGFVSNIEMVNEHVDGEKVENPQRINT